MITKFFRLVTVSIMLAAFFCVTAAAYDLPLTDPSREVDPNKPQSATTDKNYVYIGRYKGLDYFLDVYSIEVKKDAAGEQSWRQMIFPIEEKLPSKLAKSTEQLFFTDGETAYNSLRRKFPIDALENEAERNFLRRCFEVGYAHAFGKSFVNQNLTEVVFILDKSGSMGGMEDDTIGGFNAMLEKQKAAAGDAYLTTVLFNNRSTMLHDRVPIGNVSPITEEEYQVGGTTALLDAVGETIEHIKSIQRHVRKEDRPSKTIFCITTDGMENASARYSYKDVKKLIDERKEAGWEFLFLGADIDSAEVAERMGIDRSRAANYKKDSRGSGLMYEAFDEAVTAMRSSGRVDESWKDEVESDERARK